jgi:site-specific recombinase XerD
MLLSDALTELLVAKDYTPKSFVRREGVLREFVAWCKDNGVTDSSELTKPLVRRYIAWLRTRTNLRDGGIIAGETQHTHASHVRMFLNWLVDDEMLDEKVTKKLGMPTIPQKVIEIFTPAHYERLVLASDKLPQVSLRYREKALLAILFDTGIRAQELCDLTMENLHLASAHSYVQVQGKGRKEREVGLGRKTAIAVSRYLTRGRPETTLPWVFLSYDRKKMTPNGIDRSMHRLRNEAGPKHFEGIRVSAHTFRHSFAVHFLEQGGDLYKLSRLMGHESVTTTARYLRAFQARAARLGSRSVLDNL